MNDIASEVYSFCGEHLPAPLSIDELQKNIEVLEQHLYGLVEEIKANGPINIADQLRVPGIKLIKVGLTANKLEEQIKRIVVNADISNYISSPEDLKTIAQSSIGIYKKKGKKAIPEDIVKLCKDYLKGSVLKDEFAHQIYLFRLKDGQTKLESLKNSMKKPTESSWQNTDELDDISNYSYDDPELMGWLAAGGNYGVVACPFKNGDEVLSNLVLIDLDDYDRINELELLHGWPETFTVRTGRMAPEGRHFYYMVLDVPEDLKGKITLWEADHSLGEIKLNASQCVGPGSLHPSGRRYEVVNPADIAVISWEKIQELVDQCQSTSGKKIKTGETGHDHGVSGKKSKKDSWEDQIRTEWILFPETIVNDERDGDGWVQGLSQIHPVSQHGINLSVNVKTNEWRCWVCTHNGGPLEALAVTEGLIPCDHITTGWRKKYPDVFKAVIQLARDKWPDLVPSYVLKDRIIMSGDLEVMSDRSIESLVSHNNPPTIFVREGSLTRLKETENGAIIENLSEAGLRGVLARVATYVVMSGEDEKVKYELKNPPIATVRDLLALPNYPKALPRIKGVVESPIIRMDGSIVLEPGYDKASQLYYRPAPDLIIGEIPEYPSQEDAKAAMNFILDELFHDFPYVNDAIDGDDVNKRSSSRANAIAALLTPIMRSLIDGPTPLALFDKPNPRCGATLQMKLIGMIATGRNVELMGFPSTETELIKTITAALIEGTSFICMDEVDRKLNSSFLNRVLTAMVISERILGVSKNAKLPVNVSWMFNGKNIQLSSDITGRSYWIRIDPQMARPQDRTDFKHKEIVGWAKENRGLILAKLLTIIKAWFIAGKPMADTPTWGSFEKWTKMMGSVLAFAGVQGFLENAKKLWENSDSDSAEWDAFLMAWHTELGNDKYLISDLMIKIKGSDKLIEALPMNILPLVLTDPRNKDEFGKAKKALGMIFGQIWQRRFMSNLYLEREKDRTNAQRWFVAGAAS